MNIDPFFSWLEATPVSQWVVGSPSVAFGFPGILVLHAIGMGLAAGMGLALDMRVLGVARAIPLADMRGFKPVFWFGFWLNAVSGVLLLIGYPTKALTNPVFYLKLLLIAGGVWIVVHMHRRLSDIGESAPAERAAVSQLRWMAVTSILCWAGAVTAGRLLAYTYSRLVVGG